MTPRPYNVDGTFNLTSITCVSFLSPGQGINIISCLLVMSTDIESFR